jgi:cell division protein ZapB
MQSDLKLLEEKVSSLVALCKKLQSNNHALQKEVASLSRKNEELSHKIESARIRVENLLVKLPGAEHAE